MSAILRGRVAYPPDNPKVFREGRPPAIKFKVKPDAGGKDVVIFIEAGHKEANLLAKNVAVFYRLKDDGLGTFEGVDQAAAPNPAPAPAITTALAPNSSSIALGNSIVVPVLKPAPAQNSNTIAGLYAGLYKEIWGQLEALGLDDEARRLAATTVFIEAAKHLPQ